MKIELIPVIEIDYDNQEIEAPKKHSYWNNQNVWHEYRNLLLKKAGFEDQFEPYLKGFPFYEPSKISEKNLKKIIVDHTKELREGKYQRNEQSSCFWGGYVLKINREDKYFPQSCGDLSDIIYWEKISLKKKTFYEGIPAPDYNFWCNDVIFDFSVGKYEEHFLPTPPNKTLTVNLKGLKIAVERAKSELNKLSKRVIEINQKMNLNLERIDDLLIWENPNYMMEY